MKKNMYFLVFMLLIVFSSCDSDNNNNTTAGVWLNYYPRDVTDLTVNAGGLKYNENGVEIGKWDVMKEDIIPADAFYMCIKTSDNSNYTEYLYDLGEIDGERIRVEPKTELEKEIELSFRNYQAQTRLAIHVVDYRTTGVHNLQITANQDFAGIQAGESLNEIFAIKHFAPNIVISSKSEEIVVAWGDEKHSPKTINEWLQYEPFAQAYIQVALAAIPESIPESIIFSIDLTTEDGSILHTETPVVHLIP